MSEIDLNTLTQEQAKELWLTREGAHDFVVTMHKSMYIDAPKFQLSLAVYMVNTDGAVYQMTLPLDHSQEEKDNFVTTAKWVLKNPHLAGMPEFTHYITSMEAWCLKYPAETDLTNYVPGSLSKHPDRVEVLMTIAEDRQGCMTQTTYQLVRDESGAVSKFEDMGLPKNPKPEDAALIRRSSLFGGWFDLPEDSKFDA